MKSKKINTIQTFLKKIDDLRIKELKFKVIIVKDSYFFYIRKGYEKKYFEGGHMDIKGWYSGVLTFSKTNSDFLYIFISELYYNNVNTQNLFFKILYQILIYLDLDFFRYKYKKFRKHLQNYLEKIVPKELNFNSNVLTSMLQSQEDSYLFEEAGIIIPHISIYNIIERLPDSEDVLYLDNVKSYLTSSEYMTSDLKEHHRKHHHI